MNRINMGIALCYIWLAAMRSGRTVEFVKDRAGEEKVPKGHNYIISVRVG
jgi:hypothetical protein